MSKKNELKEDLKLLLIAYELCMLTDFVDKKEKELYQDELTINVSVKDFKATVKKYDGWGFDHIDTEIRKKTEQLINII